MKKKGAATFKSAAVLFVLSALFEMASPTAEVPLMGHIYGGGAALLYHLGYAALYVALGIGLWRARRWGYRLLFAGAGLYTLDKVFMLLSLESVEIWLIRQLDRYGHVGALIDRSMLSRALTIMSLSVVLGWWGFVLYAYLRRSYFDADRESAG